SLRHELRDSERNPGLELGLDSERIDSNTRIDRNGHAVDFGALVFDGNVHNTGNTSSERLMAGDAERMPFWQAMAPSSALFVHQIERAVQFSGIGFEELPAIGDGIGLGPRRQFVDQRLHDESVVGMANRTPP